MRTIVKVSMAAVLVAALGMPGSASALLNGECGGNYSRTTSCQFTAVGPAIWVYGYTSATSIVVRVTDPAGLVTVFQCAGGSSCTGHLGVGSTGTDSFGPPPGVGPLTCTVITTGSGYFRCQSNI